MNYLKQIPAFLFTILILLIIELRLYSIKKLHYIDGGGSFFTVYKKLVSEDKKQTFDIVMYGDSRSLSIKGNAKTDKLPYSLYNFSLPAAGPKYFPYFFKKYLDNHTAPKLVVYAVDPEQFMDIGASFEQNPNLWNQYKHRLLNLFTITESWEQYSGRELYFIMKEYIPIQLLSVKYRQGFETILNGFKPEMIIHSKYPNINQNQTIEKIAVANYGQLNLGNFFFGNEAIVAQGYKTKLDKLNSSKQYDLKSLQNFLDYCKEKNLKMVFLNIPKAKGFKESVYFQSVIPEIQKLVSQYSNAKYIEFPIMDYDHSLFAESIHYNPKGEIQLNEDYFSKVYPQFIQLIESK